MQTETITRESLIGTTWTHTFNTNYPQLGIREWTDNPASEMVEVYRMDTGAWITRDWPALALKYITQNWYAQDTAPEPDHCPHGNPEHGFCPICDDTTPAPVATTCIECKRAITPGTTGMYRMCDPCYRRFLRESSSPLDQTYAPSFHWSNPDGN